LLSSLSSSCAHPTRPLRTAGHRAAATRPVRGARQRAARSPARTSPRRTRRQARSLQLVSGLLAVGIGVALLIRADLGVASWDVLHVALADRSGVSVGTVSLVVGVGAVGLAAVLGERPRPGTLVPIALVAPTLDLTLAAVDTPLTLVGRSGMLFAGMALLAVGVGAYIASDHGAGPADLVFLGLARHGLSLGASRFVIDGTLVALGWALGGPVGIGTLVVTVGLAPMIALAMRAFDLTPSRATVGRLDREFHRLQGLELHHELEGPLQPHREPPQPHREPPQAHRAPPQAHRAPPQPHRAPPQPHRAPPQPHRAPPQPHRVTPAVVT
jgi:uncharacterized membrane protein YczE